MGHGTISAFNTSKAIYCSPAQVEAVAALLVVSSAALHVYKYVHFKGDAKIIIVCVNDLSLHLKLDCISFSIGLYDIKLSCEAY